MNNENLDNFNKNYVEEFSKQLLMVLFQQKIRFEQRKVPKKVTIEFK